MIMILVSKEEQGIPSFNTFVGWLKDGSNFSVFLPWVSGCWLFYLCICIFVWIFLLFI